MNMPIDIFAEIALYLHPIDLVHFARANKFFRQIIMSRSFIHVWRSAERNIDGLPPCPEELCEPQYAALVFTKYCSTCGEMALRPMDPILQVRLCVKCREKHAVETSRVTDRTLVFSSRTLVPGRRSYWTSWCLYDDARAVKIKLNELASNDKYDERVKWLDERRGLIGKRVEAAQPLIQFLKGVEDEHDAELSTMKKQREADVRLRLVKLGWDEQDINYWDRNWRKQWKSSACVARPFTEREWETNILPTLVIYLETNKSRRLERERNARQYERRERVLAWINSIKDNLAPFAQALDSDTKDLSMEEPSARSDSNTQCQSDLAPKDCFKSLDSTRVLRMAIPSGAYITQWPEYETIIETEQTHEELALALEKSRPTFDKLVLDWINELEQTLVELLPDEPADCGGKLRDTDETTPLNIPIPRYILIMCGDSKIRLTSLTGNLRRLLRADTVFMRGTQHVFYPDDFSGIFDKNTISYDPEAAKISQALLSLLGRPNSTYLEMKAAGAIFACGRCIADRAMCWKDLIRHYMEDIHRNNIAQKHARVRSSAVNYISVHNVDEIIPTKPLLKTASSLSADAYNVVSYRHCLICKSLGLRFRASKTAVLDHIHNVHRIETLEEGKHYG